MIALDDLRFVEALSRTGSLSAAARSLNVTPPALSMRLKRLEQALGVNLVVRSSPRLRFTSDLVLEWSWYSGDVWPIDIMDIANNGWQPPPAELMVLLEFTGQFGGDCEGSHVFHTPATPAGDGLAKPTVSANARGRRDSRATYATCTTAMHNGGPASSSRSATSAHPRKRRSGSTTPARTSFTAASLTPTAADPTSSAGTAGTAGFASAASATASFAIADPTHASPT